MKIFGKFLLAALLCGAALQLYAQNSKPVPGEPKADIQARLKANLLVEKNGDVSIKPFARYVRHPRNVWEWPTMLYVQYIDAAFDREALEKLLSGPVENPDPAMLRTALGAYFASKKMSYDKIAFRKALVRKYLERGVPVISIIFLDDATLRELTGLFADREKERAELAQKGDISNFLEAKKRETKKFFQKIRKGSGSRAAILTGYNAKTREFQMAFSVDGFGEPFWITEEEFDKLARIADETRAVGF